MTNFAKELPQNTSVIWSEQAEQYGAVHILRQPGEGAGIRQMLTIADEGGRGGQPKADHC